ncbi:MAG: adenylate cyclase, partial [Acidimicrobiaceae bacterium]|nr:adenylate cyclase [Acidimicrobiaceae bacterium]
AALVFVWVAATTGILFAVIKHTVGLRVPPEVEVSGLDIFEHGQPGYVFRATENGSESAEAVVGATSNGSHNGAGHLNAEAGALED